MHELARRRTAMRTDRGRGWNPSSPSLAVGSRLLFVLLAACGGPTTYENLADLSVCDPSGEFTTDVDNRFFPLPVGQRIVLEGGGLTVRITVLDELETVAGVETRVVEEHEASGGRVLEISRNFFAQAVDGTVCYFGEDVDIYDESGNVTSHAGEWRATGANVAGIFMPASPEVGQAFQQEIAPGIAEDQSRIEALGERITVPAGTFEDTVTMLDLDPLDGGQDRKVYAAGVGLIVDESAEMTSFEPAA
jgi:hypothetical protein